MSELITPERLTTRRSAVADVLDGAGVEHFEADELYRHHDENWPWDELYPPPSGMASNVEQTARVADRIREQWGGPVRVVSGYRTPVYNDLIRNNDSGHIGAEDSQHMYFRALDLQPVEPESDDYSTWVAHCREAVESERRRGRVVGFGTYPTFVHIDVGGRDEQAEWSQR